MAQSTRNRPVTLTDFRRLGKKRLARGGRTAHAARKLHIARERIRAEMEDLRRIWEGGAERFLIMQTTLVPIGGKCRYVSVIYDRHPRRQNWRLPVPTNSRIACDCREINCGRYSSRCTYTKFEYEPAIRSCARVRPAYIIYWLGDQKGRRIRAPHGYRWDVDANGLRLVAISRPQDDYHVDSDDLSNLSPLEIARKLRGNASTRRQVAREMAARKRTERLAAKQERRILQQAEREGATVCVADSVRVGNCAAGTKAWANRHGLDPSQHYRPSQVLALANGDTRRVALVVTAALRRHRDEMARGYALLADHTL